MVTKQFIEVIHGQTKYYGYQSWSTMEVIPVLKLVVAPLKMDVTFTSSCRLARTKAEEEIDKLVKKGPAFPMSTSNGVKSL